jgi:hypothetical protein
MKRHGYAAAVPRLKNPENMPTMPMLNLSSTYVQNALDVIPKTGATGQWKPRTNYFSDLKDAKRGDITTDMQFYRPATSSHDPSRNVDAINLLKTKSNVKVDRRGTRRIVTNADLSAIWPYQ